MCKVTIVDSPCGYGKTSWAIQMMDTMEFERFMYITPIIPEVKRVKNSCNRVFKEPNEKQGKGSKRNHFYNLVKEGHDIVSTHALFRGVNKEVKDTIKEMEYILILDEVMDVVEQIKISTDDINILLEQEIISVDDKNRVYWKNEEYKGEFKKYYNPIKNGDVYLHNGIMILWTFPAEIFNSFKKVYILTYLFKGQIQRYYYDMNNVDYEYKSVECASFGENKHYRLIDYKDIGGSQFKDLINIYQGKLNNIGDDKYSLSKSWFDKSINKAPLRTLVNNTSNYFKHIVKGKSDENMWTTFKDYRDKTKGKGYSKGFVECTARGTNDYKHKTNLAYLINRFNQPMIEQFFVAHGVAIDEDTWALSELIQWTFRSAIRENKPINIYIPSQRMRDLFIDWLKK